VWRDWALIAVIMTTATLEFVLRDDVAWRPVAWLLAVGVAFALLWRRSHPLAVVAVAFGGGTLVHVAALIGGREGVGLNTSLYVVLFPYSLFRWGSGRETVIGVPIILVAFVIGIASDFTGYGEAALAGVVVMFPAAVGAAVRYRVVSRMRELDQVKLRERAELARELHDTVAHHVSAIAIRAQAGRLLGRSDQAAAVDALAVIEEEASRTLAEMRTMVGGLRDGESAELGPQPGVADLERLARSVGDGPRVVVDRSGDLDDLRPSVGVAIFRIAQESVTNAIRHARHATRVEVGVAGDEDCVRVTVHDDGDAGPSRPSSGGGYGLVGMTERAVLLGGSLEAGPGPGNGWTVSAVLPREGPAT
jgi:signal transduction histidine kinase